MSCPIQDFCIHLQNQIISVYSNYTGWVGIGLGGQTMLESHLFIVSKNASNNHIMSHLKSTKNAPYKPGFLDFVSIEAIPSSSYFSFFFKPPKEFFTYPNTTFLYAATNKPPLDLYNHSVGFNKHSKRGVVSFVTEKIDDIDEKNLDKLTEASITNPGVFTTQASSVQYSNVDYSTPKSAITYNENSQFSRSNDIDTVSETRLPLLKFSGSNSSKSAQYCAQSICVFATPITEKSVLLTVQSSYLGWAGVGVGSSVMTGSTMFVGQINNTGGLVVSCRSGSTGTTPTLNPEPFTLTSSPSSLNLTAKSISFTIEISSLLFAPTGSTDLIWALSNSPGSFGYHDVTGTFQFDLQALTSVATEKSLVLVNAHGVVMGVVWGVLPILSVFVARYLKNIGHSCIAIFCGSVAGLVLIELFTTRTRFVSSPHAIIGTCIVMVFLPLQVVLGFVSNALWTAQRVEIPWWDKLHWWLGRGVILLAVVNIFLGLAMYNVYQQSTGYMIAMGIWIFIATVIFIFGQWWYGGAVHHVSLSAGTESQVVSSKE